MPHPSSSGDLLPRYLIFPRSPFGCASAYCKAYVQGWYGAEGVQDSLELPGTSAEEANDLKMFLDEAVPR